MAVGRGRLGTFVATVSQPLLRVQSRCGKGLRPSLCDMLASWSWVVCTRKLLHREERLWTSSPLLCPLEGTSPHHSLGVASMLSASMCLGVHCWSL